MVSISLSLISRFPKVALEFENRYLPINWKSLMWMAFSFEVMVLSLKRKSPKTAVESLYRKYRRS